MKFLLCSVSFIAVLGVGYGDLQPYGPEDHDSADGLVTDVDSDEHAGLLNEVNWDGADEPKNIVFPYSDEQLNEEENGPNAHELRSSGNTTTSKPSTPCETNGGECMFKKSKKNCQGTINSEHKCGQNDVCCMPGALETLMQRLLKSFPGVLEILLQSIKDNQNTMKDALSELKSNITDLSSNTEIKLNKSQAMMESNQNVLMSNLTNLKNNQDVVMGNLTNLKNNQDVVMSNLTNLGSTHCPKEFFMSTGPSRQCFKYFNDTARTWTSAVSKCHAEGLVLAEPYDPVTVRSYLVQRYGGSRWTWINGRGTGSYVTLQRSGAYVYSGNSYWYSGQPGSRTSSSYCLILMTSYANMKSYPNNTYYTYSCSSASFFTLCELIIE